MCGFQSECVFITTRLLLAEKEREVSHILLSKMYQNPKGQLEEMESWIAKKREERRLNEEKERTAALEKEFLDYVSAVKELIGKKHEKIVAWANMTAILQKKLEVVETDAERQALATQLGEAFEMQRQGEGQIEQLTEGIEEKRSDIEGKHKQEIQEIRDNYSTVSQIVEKTNILKIVLPDVQAYFQDMVTNVQRALETQRRTAEETQIAQGTKIWVREEILETDRDSLEEEVIDEAEAEVARTFKSGGPELNNNHVETLYMESEDSISEESVMLNKMVNGAIIGELLEDDDDDEEEQEELRALSEYVVLGEEDMLNAK